MSQSAATPLPSPKERRRLREAKSLSQADIAERVGVTRETVRAWEAARTDPSGRKRDAYAKLLASIAAEHAEATPRRCKARAGAPESKTKATVDGSSARTTGATQDPGRSTSSAPEPATAKTPRVQETAKAEGTEAEETAEGTEGATAAGGLTPPQAFDALYAHSATALVQQAYLLTGRRTLAVESVERAFQQAWQRWPEVAVDRDPTGWVRAAAYEYAMSPWHRMRPAHRRPATSAASARAGGGGGGGGGGEPEPTDSELLDALLSLPPAHRRALVLYDGIGLDLPETAAETEASTPATASRVMRARASVSERVSDLEGPEDLHDRLTALARGEGLTPPEGRVVRTGSDRKVRFWTRAAIAFTVLIIGATGLTVATAPTRYIPDQAPGENVGGVPPRMGPGPLTVQDQQLKKHLTTHPAHVPGRLVPKVE